MIYESSFVVRETGSDYELSIRCSATYEYEPATKGDFETPSEGPLTDVHKLQGEYVIAKFGTPKAPLTLEKAITDRHEAGAYGAYVMEYLISQVRDAILELHSEELAVQEADRG